MVADLLLQQFARSPVLGQVKTRLAPTLGEEGALALHQRLVFHCCNTLLESRLAPVQLWVAGNPDHSLFKDCIELGVEGVYRQCEGDLGARMAQALGQALHSHQSVILVGSDIPGLDTHYLAAAVEALQNHDAVLGPATDGGYVLIGLKQFPAHLMKDIDWGSDRVLAQTEQRLEQLGWRWQRLSPLPDIDRPEDLCHLPRSLAGHA
jgi:rSAM/selenodomain-associated transferase 1